MVPRAFPDTYTLRSHGRARTCDYRVFIEKNGCPVSPFHDIPLYEDKDSHVFNMVVEVPRWTNEKYEISRTNTLNPIHQDQAGGVPRYVRNRYPHHGYIWNYGALPQTWEDPNYVHPDTDAKGDNDPIDACDIAQAVSYAGQVKQVKILGILGLIDSGETDWKLIVIDVRDPMAQNMHDIDDVDRIMPGFLTATREWFRLYKVPDGSPPNDFAYDGNYQSKTFARGVIEECHRAWDKLIVGKSESGQISCTNVTVDKSPFRIDPGDLDIPKDEHLKPAPRPKVIDEWFFIPARDVPGEHQG
ncbi:hypothetical protein PV08_01000 [Exophiala spinifera]|uniref:Inorganic pyrophosphatase n=1 Tax=Exophiala spinifera TaxID=91928 RepID=A0A0D2BPH7_9EURO|nr:uncharacterized protein PV08_01000 [Exophiala spinifera]KIW20425.1 hypothetical protein PV08_01000 [Exophiala spinifera]